MLRQIVQELARLVSTREFNGAQSYIALGALGVIVIVLSYIFLRRRNITIQAKKLRQETVALIASTFCISPTTGFLPWCPIQRLPEQFAAWEKLLARLPELNATGGLDDAIQHLPPFDVESIADHPPLMRRAQVVVGLLTQSYLSAPNVPWHLSSETAKLALTVNGVPKEVFDAKAPREASPRSDLPEVLAKPMFEISQRLGFQHPISCAAQLDMWNWALVSSTLTFQCVFEQ